MIDIFNVIRLVFTWGSPILGGYVSQADGEFRKQTAIINGIQAVSILLLIMAAPETTFHRSDILSESETQDEIAPAPLTSTIISTGSTPSGSKLKSYFRSTMAFTNGHSASKVSLTAKVLPLRALAAPSTLLTLLLTAPLFASAFGVANSLSLLFSSMPTFIFPARLGYLFTLPLVLALIFYAIAAFSTYLLSRPPNHLSTSRHLGGAIGGLLLGASGLISFGLYTSGQLTPQTNEDSGTVFSLDATGQNLSLRIVSLLFGLLVAGSVVLSYSGSQHLLSTTSSAEREMEDSHRVLQEILSGIFIIAFPAWIGDGGSMLAGLKLTAVTISVLQMVAASSAAALFWTNVKEISRLDVRVLGTRRQGVPGSITLKRWNTDKSLLDA